MKYFGTPYPSTNPAPIYTEAEHVPTPVGQKCIQCEGEILAGDNGFILPGFDKDGDVYEDPWHRNCFHLATFGPELLEIIKEEGLMEFGERLT